MKGDFTMKEIIKEIIEFDLDEGRMDYLDDMIDVFSKDGCEMVDILFDLSLIHILPRPVDNQHFVGV